MPFLFLPLADQPYDAKYLLFVYGPRVYNNFVALARGLTSVTYQSSNDKDFHERAHTLFLLLMVVLLFSDGFESGFELTANESGQQQQQQQQSIAQDSYRTPMNRSSSTASDSSSSVSSFSSASVSPASMPKFNDKLRKIQQGYIEMACRYLHDEFGVSVGRRMFQNLVPLLFGMLSFDHRNDLFFLSYHML